MPSPDIVIQEVHRFLRAARPETDSDRALVERYARTRNERAFAELVRRHGPMVLGVCRRVLRNTDDADDAFQATFLILVRRAAGVRDPDRLGPWLFGVAWRTANKLRVTRPAVTPLPDDLPGREPVPGADWPAELDAAIARLPEKYRTPVVLCHLQGLSPAEVAGRLGCAASTVATRLFRARAALRRRLAALGLAVPAALVAGAALQVPVALASVVGSMAAGRTISPRRGPTRRRRFPEPAHDQDPLVRDRRGRLPGRRRPPRVPRRRPGTAASSAGGSGHPPQVVTPEAPPPLAIVPPARADSQPPATVTTANFRVTAPSTRIARLVADVAERTRKDMALTWLRKELPRRPEPCPIAVTVSHQGSGGATSFDFTGGKVFADMHVEGELDRLLADIVPHEVTHTVLADHFKSPLPRWADEGVRLLSESGEEGSRHTQVVRDTLNEGSGLQLKGLFAARDFPRNVMGFFAQSYSVTKFLVERKDCPTFVRFITDGMKDGWEPAAKTHYGFASVNELERAWIEASKAAAKAPPPAPKAGPAPPPWCTRRPMTRGR